MTTLQVSAQKQLRQLVEQIERLEEEKKALAGDIRDKYLEAKAVGFDPKALRKIVSLRKKSQTDRQEEEAILAVYMHALGMIDEACPGRQRARRRRDGRGGGGGLSGGGRIASARDRAPMRARATRLADRRRRLAPRRRRRASRPIGCATYCPEPSSEHFCRSRRASSRTTGRGGGGSRCLVHGQSQAAR